MKASKKTKSVAMTKSRNISYLNEAESLKIYNTSALIYNAGGGMGRDNLNFQELTQAQVKMYNRTLTVDSELGRRQKEQEKRQITVVEKLTLITVNMAREEFPHINADIVVGYRKAESQNQWEPFLADICKKLNIDFIFTILDRSDNAPVWRILALRDKGEYLVRQRESSSILEVLNSGVVPINHSWPITKDINDVQKDLEFDRRFQPMVDQRVDGLINKPVTRKKEFQLSDALLKAQTPQEAIKLVLRFHRRYGSKDEDAHIVFASAEEEEEYDLYGRDFDDNITKYDKEIDIVSLHRLCFECLSRFSLKGKAADVTLFCFGFIYETLERFRTEADVAVLGLRLLNDLTEFLSPEMERVYHAILNCMQAFAPPPPQYKVRRPHRLKPPEETYIFGATGQETKSVRSKNTVASEESKLKEKFGFDIKVLKDFGSVQDMQAGLPPRAVKTFSSTRKEDSVYFESSISDFMTDEGNESHLQEHSSLVEAAEMDKSSIHHNPFDPKIDLAGSNSLDGGTLASIDVATALQVESNDSSHVVAVPPAIAHTTTTDHIHLENIQREFSEELSLSTKGSKFKTRIKTIIDDGRAASSKQEKKLWKGTIGEIGRKAKKVVKDKKIVFTKRRSTEMPVVIDEDSDDYIRMLSMNVTDNAVPTTEQSITAAATSSALETTSAMAATSYTYSNTTSNTVDGKAGLQDAVNVSADSAAFPVPGAPTLATQATANVEAEAPTTTTTTTTTTAKVKGGRLRNKFKFKPLPLVPCIEFKGLGGKAKRNVTMMQIFATLFQVVKYSFANRSIAFKMKVMEEVSDIIQVCQEMPRLFEYFIWTVEKMYSDGFLGYESERDHEYANNLDDENDQSMQLSASQHDTRHRAHSDDDDVTIDTLTGQIIETISEMSIPVVHEGGPINDVAPVVNMGVRTGNETVKMDRDGFLIIPGDKSVTATKRSQSTLDNMDDATYGDTNVAIFDGGKKEATFVRNFYNRPKPGASATGPNSGNQENNGKGAADKDTNKSSNNRFVNQEIMNELGLFEFEARYVNRPHDDIVVAVAMVSSHCELEKREQQVAISWLDIWDDGSFEYKMLKKKGLDLSGL